MNFRQPHGRSSTEGRKFFAQGPKVRKKSFSSTKSFSSKVSYEFAKCSFDNPAEGFQPEAENLRSMSESDIRSRHQ